MVLKEKIWSGRCCQKFFVSQKKLNQSQPNHNPITFPSSSIQRLQFAGPPTSLFFASFGINTPSPKSRDGCKLLEPILVPLINHFGHTSGTSRWWSGQSKLFCILTPAEKLCIHAPKRARCAIFPTPMLQPPPIQQRLLRRPLKMTIN